MKRVLLVGECRDRLSDIERTLADAVGEDIHVIEADVVPSHSGWDQYIPLTGTPSDPDTMYIALSKVLENADDNGCTVIAFVADVQYVNDADDGFPENIEKVLKEVVKTEKQLAHIEFSANTLWRAEYEYVRHLIHKGWKEIRAL